MRQLETLVFRQIGEHLSGLDVFRPLFADLYEYLIHLYEILDQPNLNERKVLGRMKKFLNFVGLGVDPKGEFLFRLGDPILKRNSLRLLSVFFS